MAYHDRRYVQLVEIMQTLYLANLADRKPWISKLWLTDDPSFVPQGFSAQVRFNRLRRQPSAE